MEIKIGDTVKIKNGTSRIMSESLDMWADYLGESIDGMTGEFVGEEFVGGDCCIANIDLGLNDIVSVPKIEMFLEVV